jgi:hypothetical protein
MKLLAVIGLLLFGAVFAEQQSCDALYKEFGLSANKNETIAHAIHSMTTFGLSLFSPFSTEANRVPTVNHDLRDSSHSVLDYAPVQEISSEFTTFSMNMIDTILSNVGVDDDGLGEHWSPTERIAHKFHMIDLWVTIKQEWQRSIVAEGVYSAPLCECLLDTKANGIYDAVQWVANHYKSGTPITLLNRPIPKLTDGRTWQVWKARLLYYYSKEALFDAALYLDCTSRQFVV